MGTTKDMVTGIKISEFDRQSISIQLSGEFDLRRSGASPERPGRCLEFHSVDLCGPLQGDLSPVQGLIRAILDVFRVAPRVITPSELTSELYRPEVALAEFRRFGPDGVDEVNRETLQAMELATVMG